MLCDPVLCSPTAAVFSAATFYDTHLFSLCFSSDNGPGMEKWWKHGLLRQPYNKQSLWQLLRCEGKNKDNNLWTWHQDAQSYCEVMVDLVQHWAPAQRLLIQVGFFSIVLSGQLWDLVGVFLNSVLYWLYIHTYLVILVSPFYLYS